MGFHAFKEGRETSIAEMGLKWEGARRVGGRSHEIRKYGRK